MQHEHEVDFEDESQCAYPHDSSSILTLSQHLSTILKIRKEVKGPRVLVALSDFRLSRCLNLLSWAKAQVDRDGSGTINVQEIRFFEVRLIERHMSG